MIKDHFQYRAKAKELHRLRIALEKERHGYSSILIRDAWDLAQTAMEAALAIHNFFRRGTHRAPRRRAVAGLSAVSPRGGEDATAIPGAE